MKPFFSKRAIIAIAIISLLLVMWLATNQFANANFPGNIFPPATSTPGNPIASEIEIIQKQLNDPNIDRDYRQKLEERLKGFHQQETLVKTLSAKKMPTFQDPSTRKNSNLTPNPKSGRVLRGIFDYPFLPERKDVIIENAWNDLVDGQYVTIYAGYLANDEDQSEVCFQSERVPLTCVHAPEKAGPIRVVEHKAKENKLVLKSKSGKEFFFDIRGKKFAKSVDEEIPTATPFASPTSSIGFPYP